MILLLDCGNSRFKWALAGPHGWISQGNIPNQEIGTLALRDWQSLPRPARAVGVNVAGEATRVRVEAQPDPGFSHRRAIDGLRWSRRGSGWPTSCSRRRAWSSTRAPR